MVQVDGQETKVAARLTHKVFFERDDIEFTFQWLLSFVHCGGVSQGEVFKLARNIDPSSLTIWKTEFEKEAVKIEATAELCLKKGHLISAGEAFIRAHSYYRAAFYGAFPANRISHGTTAKVWNASARRLMRSLSRFPMSGSRWNTRGISSRAAS
ncbi:hypothetical protein [Paenibacillus sp. FSL R7-0333]|uniref:hypothetical protein n=1 Tax=Paenibacillus sp. FSL R7-0333 TaxID=1926587 RepID=UPI00096CC90E|nr:hypothetical protein BK146_27505 [Paenibacillus sp. FSL R7-0333]